MSKKKKRKPSTGLPLAFIGTLLKGLDKGSDLNSTAQSSLGQVDSFGYRTESSERLGAEGIINPIGVSKDYLSSDMSTGDKLKGVGTTALSTLAPYLNLGGKTARDLYDKYSGIAKEDDRLKNGMDYLETQHVDRNIPTFALGGEMGVDTIQGASHEGGGVNIGGIVEAEGNETKAGNVIYSDRLKLSKQDIKNYELPKNYLNMTIAEATKKIEDKYSLRKNDPIDEREKEKELNTMTGIQREKQQEYMLKQLEKLKKSNPQQYKQVMSAMMQGQAGQPNGMGRGQGLHLGLGDGSGTPKAAAGYEFDNPPKRYGYKSLSSDDQSYLNEVRQHSQEIDDFYNKVDWDKVDKAGGIKVVQQKLEDNDVRLIGGVDDKTGDITLYGMMNNPELWKEFKREDSSFGYPIPDIKGSGLVGKLDTPMYANDIEKNSMDGIGNKTNYNPSVSGDMSYKPTGLDAFDISAPVSTLNGEGEEDKKFKLTDAQKTTGMRNLGNLFDIGRGIYGMLKPKIKPNLMDAPQLDAAYLDPTRAIQDVRNSSMSAGDSMKESSLGVGTLLASRLALARGTANSVSSLESKYDETNAQIFNRTNAQNAQTKLHVNSANQQELRYNEQINQQERDVAANMLGEGLRGISENSMLEEKMANERRAQDVVLLSDGEHVRYEKQKDGTYKKVPIVSSTGNNEQLTVNTKNETPPVVKEEPVAVEPVVEAPVLDGVNPTFKFESESGSANGTGLNNYGITDSKYKQGKYASYWDDNGNISREGATNIYNEIKVKYDDLPSEYVPRIVDYAYNSGRSPEDLMLYANGDITKDQLRSEASSKHTSIWNEKKEEIKANMENDSNFKDKMLEASVLAYVDNSHSDLHKPSSAYNKSWRKRISTMYGVSESKVDKVLQNLQEKYK